MSDYLKTMEKYSPASAGTGQSMDEKKVFEVDSVPQTTAVMEEERHEDAPYMAPKTIEVRRFTLKK